MSTIYQSGPRSFDNLEDAESFARRADFPTVAIVVDGKVVSEHEVSFDPTPAPALAVGEWVWVNASPYDNSSWQADKVKYLMTAYDGPAFRCFAGVYYIAEHGSTWRPMSLEEAAWCEADEARMDEKVEAGQRFMQDQIDNMSPEDFAEFRSLID